MPGSRLAFDTNLLFYAVNEDSPFHPAAAAFLSSLDADEGVAVSELVLVELYRLLRNPVVNERPLAARPAAEIVEAYRRHPRWLLVALPVEQRRLHDRLWRIAAQPDFASRRVYDARLALSLVQQGVTEFATANVHDFRGLGFQRVWNPLEPAEPDRQGQGHEDVERR
ncbi:MAG: TA system VapC family ribonuclease toxin [Thermoanaerobaculia bacterium]